ncbi:hypothetical protein SKAU_G00064670 [Synaphobranchus kaupii]|uniref:Uncharacterized protein n=1 Tax=Synaphobranchus kaupii TaxID=118154 RepID=A0A9Q1JB43_SYNKA|nr:hypothetical protein SKAU_G00064670 [Synaphobranchus kaupii]
MDTLLAKLHRAVATQKRLANTGAILSLYLRHLSRGEQGGQGGIEVLEEIILVSSYLFSVIREQAEAAGRALSAFWEVRRHLLLYQSRLQQQDRDCLLRLQFPPLVEMPCQSCEKEYSGGSNLVQADLYGCLPERLGAIMSLSGQTAQWRQHTSTGRVASPPVQTGKRVVGVVPSLAACNTVATCFPVVAHAWGRRDNPPLGSDALAHQWPLGLLYPFPPFSVLQPLLRRVQMERVRFILAPLWPHMVWFLAIPPLLDETPWELPVRRDLLSQAGGSMFHPFPQGLQLCAWPLRGQGS